MWFAFVLWTTFDWYQLDWLFYLFIICCDLLSFFELLLIDINVKVPERKRSLLWFAFVLWTTFDWYQLIRANCLPFICCDLLSFFELLLIDINGLNLKKLTLLVVICFRSLNYFWLISTFYEFRNNRHRLWFAFVLWTTFDWYQRHCFALPEFLGCDLLSFFELLLIDINRFRCKSIRTRVSIEL